MNIMLRRRDILRIAAGAMAARALAPLELDSAIAGERAGGGKRYALGVTDTEIKIGQTWPYSGPISSYAPTGRAEVAFFKMINDQGGINGRKVNLISVDDAYSPPKTVEQIRRLVERDQVAFIFQSLGDVTNAAIQRYLNDRHIPQLFVADGSSRWNDPRHFPWTMGWSPSFQTEAHIHAKYILQSKPGARIAVLVQDSLAGREYFTSLKEGLGERVKSMTVNVQTYQVTDATVDSQILLLAASGANVLLNFSVPKFAAQVIRKIYDIGWKPLHLMSYISSSVSEALKPAGLDKCVGIVSVAFLKFPDDPRWRDDPAMKAFYAWMDKYFPEGDRDDWALVYAYLVAQTLVQVLKQCGDDLSRENVMRQAANLHDVELPLLLPGIRINTSPSDYRPVKQMQPMRFNGRSWELFGDSISG
jgi:branched-chain amino acid transport system substrate-binding protein